MGASERMPRYLNCWQRESWVQDTGGRPWYEKDDGSCIYWYSMQESWACFGVSGDPDPGFHHVCYWLLKRELVGGALQPPAEGWSPDSWWQIGGRSPAPTLRVLS